MGQIPTNELNAFGTFISFLFFLAAPALYLLPTFEAWLRKHLNLSSIALVNIFLGWSLIGWVIAAVWAFKKPEPSVTAVSAIPAAPEALAQDTKKCPFCAETFLPQLSSASIVAAPYPLPNNSFKPNLLRYSKSRLQKT